MVAIVCVIYISTIMQRLCFLFCESTKVLIGSCLATACVSHYAKVYSTVFGAVLGIHIVGVG